MDTFGVTRCPEYQAVIIVEPDDGRLFPLTEGCPKCLLPIANRRLLAFQLDLLSKSCALEIYIVAPREYHTQLSQFLSEYGNADNASVEFVWVDDMVGSADGLRAVNERIRGDFICMGSDILCQYSLGEIADLHRSRASDITMLLVSAPTEESEKKGAPKKIRIDEEDQEYIGVCEDGRVVMKTPALEIEESLKVLKPLLHRCSSSLTLRNDLQDMGVYVMSKWVLNFLMANKKVSSLRTELVPLLVHRQFQSQEYLDSVMPALKGRTGTLSLVDRWLSQLDSSNISPEDCLFPRENKELVDYLYDTVDGRKTSRILSTTSSKDLKDYAEKAISMPMSPVGKSSLKDKQDKGADNQNVDLLRCFAVIYERKGYMGAHGTQRTYRELDGLHLIQRVSTLQSYMNLNRDVPLHQHDVTTSWPPISGYHKKELSVIGEGCDLGDKVTVKQCSIGKGCQIGAKSKLNNCVLMDYTIIGESCTIQNTVLSAGCVVKSNCNINECNVGCGAKIAGGSKIKLESISSAT